MHDTVTNVVCLELQQAVAWLNNVSLKYVNEWMTLNRNHNSIFFIVQRCLLDTHGGDYAEIARGPLSAIVFFSDRERYQYRTRKRAFFCGNIWSKAFKKFMELLSTFL